MKKMLKSRLTLNRETLAHLEEQDLGQIAGGTSSPKICTFSGYQTCATCQNTCGTNYC